MQAAHRTVLSVLIVAGLVGVAGNRLAGAGRGSGGTC